MDRLTGMLKRLSLIGFALLLALTGAANSAPVAWRVDALLAQDLSEDATREKVAKELAALGEEGSWVLAERLERKDLFVFMALREALMALDATACPALRAYAGQPPEHRARGAMAILAQIAKPADAGFFVTYLADERWVMRAQAARGLGRTGIHSATVESGLKALLDDPDDSVRRYATSALGKVGTPESASRLLEKLSDDSFFVRRAAARAIGRVWERSATAEVDLSPVLALTGGEVELPTRLLAMELLSKRPEEKAVERLKTLSAHPDWAVRAAAVRALLPGHKDWVKANLSPAGETDMLVRTLLLE